METKVIYVTPDCGVYIGELEAMPKDELLCFAKNCNECEVYSLDEFQAAFNEERISDLGYIFFV